MRWAVVMRPPFCRDDRGATSLEYMIVVGAVALMGLAGFSAFGETLSAKVRCFAVTLDAGEAACSSQYRTLPAPFSPDSQLGDAIWDAASEASSDHTASSSSEEVSQASEGELRERSKDGNVEATVELNKRRAAAARAAGNAASARGHEIENEELAVQPDLQAAGRMVEYQIGGRTAKTDIDAETSTEVIQIKSGTELPSKTQAEATRRFAQETNRTAKVRYDPARVPRNAVREFQQKYPDIVLEPRRYRD